MATLAAIARSNINTTLRLFGYHGEAFLFQNYQNFPFILNINLTETGKQGTMYAKRLHCVYSHSHPNPPIGCTMILSIPVQGSNDCLQ